MTEVLEPGTGGAKQGILGRQSAQFLDPMGFFLGLSAPGHPNSLPQKVGMERPSPAKVPLMAPGLSPSVHETVPTSSGVGSNPLAPGSL